MPSRKSTKECFKPVRRFWLALSDDQSLGDVVWKPILGMAHAMSQLAPTSFSALFSCWSVYRSPALGMRVQIFYCWR